MLRITQLFLLFSLSSSVLSYEVDFKSPEGWAMSYTSSSSLNLAQIAPNKVEVGDLSVSVELGSIPSLSNEQQKVGFNGLKDEDLNKSPIFGRIRFSLGLPWDITGEASITPPLEIDGAKPKTLWGLAFSRPFIEGESIEFGTRIFLTRGQVEADVTCSKETALIEPYKPGNLSGCIGTSNDQLSVDHEGIEFILAYKSSLKGFKPWISFASTQLNSSVKVDAPLQSGQELVNLSSEGTIQTYSLGVNYSLSERQILTFASSYTPLDVLRPVNLDDRDSFWNFKIGFALSF